jgi:glutamine amidotransferase
MRGTISVVSYGVCNVGSILNMLKKIGADAEPVSTPDGLRRATKIILPGIGAFDNGVKALRDLALSEPLIERAGAGVPVLGICLGMQLLGNSSEEGTLPGLGLLTGRCVRLRSSEVPPLRVPHMGWNEITWRADSALLDGLSAEARFYFVHSYHLACAEPRDILATTHYGVEFAAMVHRDNVWGAQFHPEKSHRYGMTLLRNFARL